MASRKIRITFFEIILIVLALGLAAGGLFLIIGGRTSVSQTGVMEQRLRELRQLKTVTQTYRSVIYVEEKNFWRGRKQVLFTVEYLVTAGVDFSRGLEIRELSDGTVQVRMPPAEIFISDADESSIHQMYLRENSFLNPIRMGDYMSQIIVQGEANRQAALDGGILSLAEANARLAVLRVLKLGKLENITFVPGNYNG
ncbi:MAG: hypothetical protein DRP60_16090 [Spirochaetes bacterium]|nr:MAG: hypothetical protein DRP60_16090 [Spirochaetota bacterium]